MTESFLKTENREFSLHLELIYLCAHATTHWGGHGLHYWEIYRYFLKHKFDINLLIDIAKKTNSLMAFALSIYVIKRWWNVEIIEDSNAWIANHLTFSQKFRLKLVDLFFILNFEIDMQNRWKKILEALISDRILGLLRLVFGHDRLNIARVSRKNIR